MNKEPLNEKDFIHEEYGKDPTPFWIWSFIILCATALIWGLMLWYNYVMSESHQNPFLQVTNRQFSLFLWQNPEHMRVHAKNKTGYLSAFHYVGKVGLDPLKAEEFVEAPPEIMFLYHTWDRLLGDVVFDRPIDVDQFTAFLNDAEEWKGEYVLDSLPKKVKQAFFGWLNYFKEGDAINALQPTYGEVEVFLKKYPQYSRDKWTQIVKNYLRSSGEADQIVPREEIAPFLRVALFNYNKAFLN